VPAEDGLRADQDQMPPPFWVEPSEQQPEESIPGLQVWMGARAERDLELMADTGQDVRETTLDVPGPVGPEPDPVGWTKNSQTKWTESRGPVTIALALAALLSPICNSTVPTRNSEDDRPKPNPDLGPDFTPPSPPNPAYPLLPTPSSSTEGLQQ
jgi:hypothetical protein